MSETAIQTMYRDEYIAGFEQRQSLVRRAVVTEADINARDAVFLVADSGGASAVTRGINGDIPTRADNLNQFTATLKEWHDVPERTGFNIYTSQGNAREIMQMTTMGVMNRRINSDIYTELATGTVTDTITTATSAQMFADLLSYQATLAENNAFYNEEPFAVVTPTFVANMMTITQFTSSDYISDKKFEGFAKTQAFAWHGFNFIVAPDLPGVGTATASCYFFVRNAIGHACDIESVRTRVGYDDKNDKSWCRASTFMGSKLLQNSGLIVVTHDDTAIIGA